LYIHIFRYFFVCLLFLMAPVSKIVYPEGVLTPSSSSKNHNLQMKSLVQKKSSFNTTITTTEATQINQDLIKNYHLISN